VGELDGRIDIFFRTTKVVLSRHAKNLQHENSAEKPHSPGEQAKCIERSHSYLRDKLQEILDDCLLPPELVTHLNKLENQCNHLLQGLVNDLKLSTWKNNWTESAFNEVEMIRGLITNCEKNCRMAWEGE
jgi:hypothetical protein